MKTLVLGGDGYCGWPTSLNLSDSLLNIALDYRERVDPDVVMPRVD